MNWLDWCFKELIEQGVQQAVKQGFTPFPSLMNELQDPRYIDSFSCEMSRWWRNQDRKSDQNPYPSDLCWHADIRLGLRAVCQGQRICSLLGRSELTVDRRPTGAGFAPRQTQMTMLSEASQYDRYNLYCMYSRRLVMSCGGGGCGGGFTSGGGVGGSSNTKTWSELNGFERFLSCVVSASFPFVLLAILL